MQKYESVLGDAHKPVVAAFGQILEVWTQLGLPAEQVAARGRSLEQKVVNLAKQLLEGEQKQLLEEGQASAETYQAVELLAVKLGEGCPDSLVRSRQLKKNPRGRASCSDCSSYSYSDDELPLPPRQSNISDDGTQSLRARNRSRSRSPATGARAKAKAKANGRSGARENSCDIPHDAVSPFETGRLHRDARSHSSSRSRNRRRRQTPDVDHKRYPAQGHAKQDGERKQKDFDERSQSLSPQTRVGMSAMPYHARPDARLHEAQWTNSLAGATAWSWTHSCYGAGIPPYPLQHCSMPQVQHELCPWYHPWHAGLQPHSQRATAGGITTLAVRNIPSRYSQEELLKEFDPDGLQINFFYVPFDSRQEKYMGFAFANFWTPQMASTFQTKWNRQRLRNHGRNKYLTVVSATSQGLEKNLLQFTEKGVERMQKTGSLPAMWERPGCRADIVQVLRIRGLMKPKD